MNNLLDRFENLVEIFTLKGIVLDRACDDLDQYQFKGDNQIMLDQTQELIWRLAKDRKLLAEQINVVRNKLISQIDKTLSIVVIDAIEVSMRNEL